jgi:hypothetical protein
MKYICPGYCGEKHRETLSENKRQTFMDECFACDDVLRRNGHFAGGEALEVTGNAVTL